MSSQIRWRYPVQETFPNHVKLQFRAICQNMFVRITPMIVAYQEGLRNCISFCTLTLLIQLRDIFATFRDLGSGQTLSVSKGWINVGRIKWKVACCVTNMLLVFANLIRHNMVSCLLFSPSRRSQPSDLKGFQHLLVHALSKGSSHFSKVNHKSAQCALYLALAERNKNIRHCKSNVWGPTSTHCADVQMNE